MADVSSHQQLLGITLANCSGAETCIRVFNLLRFRVGLGFSAETCIRVFNLLRDDLGTEGDATEENYEVAYSRGIPAGEYIVNVHMYGPIPPGMTVPATVVVSVRKEFEQTKQILKTQVMLKRRHQEETAFRFRLTSKGELVKDSVTTLRRRLITEPM